MNRIYHKESGIHPPHRPTYGVPTDYILFGGDAIHYAQGGGHDLIKTSHDFEELASLGKDKKKDGSLQWWHILEVSTGKIVMGSKEQAYTAPEDDVLTIIED